MNLKKARWNRPFASGFAKRYALKRCSLDRRRQYPADLAGYQHDSLRE
jgi:hypothetical protein